MFSKLIEAAARHLMGGLGAFLVGEGVWTEADTQVTVGALVALLSFLLSVFDKKRSR